MKTSLFIVGMLALASSACAEAEAQMRFVNDSRRGFHSVARERGFGATHEFYWDALREGEHQFVRVLLRKSRTYLFVAACDTRCDGLNAELYDRDGVLIDRDAGPDEHPVIEFTPEATAEYRLRVSLADCDTDPCVWGVGVYRR